MKKIMFNERYGLEQAVLDRRKTMTRRKVVCPVMFKGVRDVGLEFHRRPGQDFYYDCVVLDGDGHELGQLPTYEIGETVAVAQSYYDIYGERIEPYGGSLVGWAKANGLDFREEIRKMEELKKSHAYENKMFVKSELMPHHIRITDLWFEHLQDISDEDAMKEGIRQSVIEYGEKKIVQWTYFGEKVTVWYDSPREAFAAMIERICGKGTWAANPWVVAYTFELMD